MSWWNEKFKQMVGSIFGMAGEGPDGYPKVPAVDSLGNLAVNWMGLTGAWGMHFLYARAANPTATQYISDATGFKGVRVHVPPQSLEDDVYVIVAVSVTVDHEAGLADLLNDAVTEHDDATPNGTRLTDTYILWGDRTSVDIPWDGVNEIRSIGLRAPNSPGPVLCYLETLQ